MLNECHANVGAANKAHSAGLHTEEEAGHGAVPQLHCGLIYCQEAKHEANW